MYCKVEVSLETFHVDHDHPHSRGGRTVLANLVTACELCNVVKGGWTGAHYRRMLKRDGLDWRNERYVVLLKEEQDRLLVQMNKDSQRIEREYARGEEAARLSRIADNAAAVAAARSYATAGENAQSPTGVFGVLQSDEIAIRAAIQAKQSRLEPLPSRRLRI